jgi:hypothetical protein
MEDVEVDLTTVHAGFIDFCGSEAEVGGCGWRLCGGRHDGSLQIIHERLPCVTWVAPIGKCFAGCTIQSQSFFTRLSGYACKNSIACERGHG